MPWLLLLLLSLLLLPLLLCRRSRRSTPRDPPRNPPRRAQADVEVSAAAAFACIIRLYGAEVTVRSVG